MTAHLSSHGFEPHTDEARAKTAPTSRPRAPVCHSAQYIVGTESRRIVGAGFACGFRTIRKDEGTSAISPRLFQLFTNVSTRFGEAAFTGTECWIHERCAHNRPLQRASSHRPAKWTHPDFHAALHKDHSGQVKLDSSGRYHRLKFGRLALPQGFFAKSKDSVR